MINKILKKIKRKFSRADSVSDLSIRKYYKDRFNKTLKNWLIYHHREIVFDKVSWMGVRILKNPMDLWIYQEILYKIKPDIIVEIGSANGGSTMYLAHLCDIMNKGKIISIDMNRDNYIAAHERIINFTGDSLLPDIIKEVEKICLNKTVLVIHDADHSEQSVYDNLLKYSHLVSLGSYFIVEDGLLDLFSSMEGIGGYSGPLNATIKFLKEEKNFIIDEDCERYLITYNPKGFLKRIR